MAMPQPSMASSLDVLSTGKGGFCEIRTIVSIDCFTVTLMDKDTFERFGSLFALLSSVCNALPVDEEYKPGPGEVVAAQSLSEDWQRGSVISVLEDTYRVAMFDIGCSEKAIKNVRKLPVKFAEMPAMGVKVRVIKYSTLDETGFAEPCVKVGQVFKFVVKNCHGLDCTADFVCNETGSHICEVRLERWAPRFEDQGLKSPVLTNGACVQVVSYADARGIFVRPMDAANDMLWQRLIQKVGAYCLTEPNLDHMPEKGELLACKFSPDDNYYRAVVLGIVSEKILVSYVDFGNKEYVTIDKLKRISQELKEVPCMAVLVEQKSVVSEFLNWKAKAFLDKLLLSSSKLLTVKLEESGSLPVDLVLADKKTTLADLINERLEPNWKIAVAQGANPAETTLFKKDITFMKLPTNKLLKLTVLYAERCHLIWACLFDCSTSRFVLTQMMRDLEEYCAALKITVYMPRVDELCTVLCDGKWMRAICLENNQTISMVHLIDFGATILVGHSSIRKICEDFIWHCAIAVRCLIVGLPEVKSPELVARLRELVSSFSNHFAKVNLMDKEETHHIEIPDLLRTLKSEGLLTD